MFNQKTISDLIWMLSPDERERLAALISSFDVKVENERNTEKREKLFAHIADTCKSYTEWEKQREVVAAAVSRGETTIPREKWGVHESHCCVKHGCKYGHEDCPVAMELTKQQYPCEVCSDEREEEQR